MKSLLPWKNSGFTVAARQVEEDTMAGLRRRSTFAVGLALMLGAALIGCASRQPPGGGRTQAELNQALGWVDPEAQAAARVPFPHDEYSTFAKQARLARKPAVLSPHKDILVISGGGVYGSYPAGVLYGWSQTGTRPTFDVVTGISTGAMVAVFAFLGPSVDEDLRCAYTMTSDKDVFKKRRTMQALLSDALNDSEPLARRIASYATDEKIRLVAMEHQKGRRLYVGTTDLDVRRGIFWDMGEIATRDTPESRELFRKVLLASASIPGFFPPVPIEVNVDGRRRIERHVDGGVSSSMFFAPPWVPPDQRENLPSTWLYGSDLYILVAGKMYPDPTPVKSRTLSIVENAVSTIIYDQTRSDLYKLFLLSIVTGMTYNVSAIPPEVPSPSESTSFKPPEMTVLFEAGAEWARTNRQWRDTPPGGQPGEGARYRAGPVLTNSNQLNIVGIPMCR